MCSSHSNGAPAASGVGLEVMALSDISRSQKDRCRRRHSQEVPGRQTHRREAQQTLRGGWGSRLGDRFGLGGRKEL